MSLADAKPFAVAAWTLDEVSGTRFDSVGSNDLADNNTVGSATGKFGNAADFEASASEWLSIADNADVSTGEVKFCLRLWVQLESKSANMVAIAKWDDDREFQLGYSSGDDRFRLVVRSADNASNSIVLTDNFGSPSLATWYLLHAWYDPTTDEIGIAVNAGTANTAMHTNNIADTNDALTIGREDNGGGASYWDGLIDDPVLIKGYLLDATERTEDYNNGDGVAFANWDAGGGPTVPALDEGMLIGGLQTLCGGIA